MEETTTQTIPNIPFSNPVHPHGGSIILLTNPSNEMYKMELALRSMILDGEGNPIKTGDALLNDEGICSVIGTVQSLVNQVAIMSNLEKGEVQMLMMSLADTLCIDLMANRSKYFIRNIAARDKIHFIAMSTAFVTLKRAFNEGDKRFWKGTTQEFHHRVEQEQQKRRDLIGFLKSWK